VFNNTKISNNYIQIHFRIINQSILFVFATCIFKPSNFRSFWHFVLILSVPKTSVQKFLVIIFNSVLAAKILYKSSRCVRGHWM
jgi:hypothetical protein